MTEVHSGPVKVKLDQEMIPLNQDSSSLVDEVNTLRQELGGLLRELRGFISRFRQGEFGDIYPYELIDILEEIIDGG